MAKPGNHEIEPCEFTCLSDSVLKKASPESEKITKVKKEKGSKVATTGKLFIGNAGGKWIQEKKEDGSPGGYLLVFGPGLGLKEPLLAHPELEFAELGAPPSKPLTLKIMSPVEAGAELLDLQIRDNWTVGQVKALLCKTTGLKAGSMIMCKGKMGERVADSASTRLNEDGLVTEQGYGDGDEIAFMYLGDPETDLAAYLESKKK
uniref:Ubiquitin-like domain-containing protein n=1 Tax=Alexandrium monilatum TaxID=311494 RepID=A0A7S4UJ23_9DINO